MDIKSTLEDAWEKHEIESSTSVSGADRAGDTSTVTEPPESGETSEASPTQTEKVEQTPQKVEVQKTKLEAKPQKRTKVGEVRNNLGQFVRPETSTTEIPVAGKPDATKPPASWGAVAREKWVGLPQEVQQEILKRDSEIQSGLRQASDSKRFHQTFQQTIAPYEPLLRSIGAEPMQVVGTFMHALSTLRTGSPQQKAQMLADIVKTNAVDISLLDQALAGQGQTQTQTLVPQQFRDPRLDEILAHNAQARAHAGKQEVENFAKEAEFLEALEPGEKSPPGSIRSIMANLLKADTLEMQEKQQFGLPHVEMTLEQAYNLACRMHPEVSKVLASREQQKMIEAQNAQAQKAKIASSTVRGLPSAAVQSKPNGKLSLRDSIYQSWNTVNGG